MFKQTLRFSRSYNLHQILLGTSRKAVAICPNVIQYQNTQMFSTAPVIKKWDLYSSVCLERHPITVQSMQEIELKFYNMLRKIEFEDSLKNDHELKKEREENQSKITKSDMDMETILIQTAQEFEDSNLEELKNFKFAPRITKFDEQNETSSLKRKLDKNLLLLVHQKIGDKHYWIPPQGIRQEGETMRQTAERVLQNECGTKIKVKFYGNAPIGFYKYKYPRKLQEKESCGAKIFYFLAKYVDGDITDNVKYQWLDHEELEKVLPREMQKSISQFML
ncbi:PREDICTED: 39S ribosomal protein L46, mitochondrial [Dinoponera quadriceps]|uniref:Large ribosomal subunit protein mL46 n=1 Tax=Dinoponera quadriceps TaxID=609295 RepID=A0A6P3XKB5_DINQU|nr:PREDICTED: 39S ribosomal protein L46, mitochondrial [Dinoponera quadriceps]XP_014478688.1 PREDICTED: 39S ribosomal protein L46, mitochondrial [Dinoponera quadriceps]